MKKLVIIALWCCTLLAHNTIYIIPFSLAYDGNGLFDPTGRDECLQPFIALQKAARKLGYNLIVTSHIGKLKDVAAIVLFNGHAHLINNLTSYGKDRCIMYLWEPPVTQPSNSSDYDPRWRDYCSKIFVMLDGYLASPGYHKFFYPQARLEPLSSAMPFEHKKLCAMINGNKSSPHAHELYSLRRQFAKYCEHNIPQDFDLYGPGWPPSSIYKGSVPSKLALLQRYKFCFCIENSSHTPGYITEKIFDCLRAGCIPIYQGSEPLDHYIPADCYVNPSHFASFDELIAFLRQFTEKDYAQFLQARDAFLISDQAFYFSCEYFCEIFFSAINPDYDRTKIFDSMTIDRINRMKLKRKQYEAQTPWRDNAHCNAP